MSTKIMSKLSRRAAFAGLALTLSIGISGCFDGASADGTPLKSYGRAPEFTGIEAWINSAPLTMASLRGKVVLVEFWTHECINCIRTLPQVTRWYNTYKDQGLVVIGVHTPESEFEKQRPGLQAAIEKFAIEYPVAQDNRFATWKAYENQFWPATYLIDRDGSIVLKHVGEGGYAETEDAIRRLLASQ
jgi:glutathione peroxidase-family protein